MRVAVVGNGGREHAYRLVLARTAEVVDDVVDADLVVIGPEKPLIEGLADELRTAGKVVFGPGRDGAQLEGSKAWMKDVLVEAGVPTAAYKHCTDADDAVRFLESLPGPYVIKTDYLMAGKGVLVTTSLSDAVEDARAKLEHGAVVIEECMSGPEASVFCVCDGKVAVPLAPARDYKRVGDGDTGPNTGGMGAFSPVDGVDAESIAKTIVQPTLDALRARGVDYRGVLYAGLMLTPDGPKIVEYNVRLGDPDGQVVLLRFDGDLASFLYEAASGELTTTPSFVDDAAVLLVLASGGYPVEPYDTGHVIEGYDDAAAMDGVTVLDAGVGPGRTVAGGRVLNVVGMAPTVSAARDKAYEAAAKISWPNLHYRRDIAS